MLVVMKKQCTRCRKVLSLLEFSIDRSRKDRLCLWCKKCVSKYQKEKRASLKKEAMIFFGGQCVYVNKNGVRCSKNAVDNLEELVLSHPNNDGNKHRNLISNGQKGDSFYTALKKRKWKTDGFVVEVMCKFHHDSSSSNPGRKRQSGKFNDPIWLRKRYIDDMKTSQAIGTECGVSSQTILNRMRRFNIDRRKRGRRLGWKKHP